MKRHSIKSRRNTEHRSTVRVVDDPLVAELKFYAALPVFSLWISSLGCKSYSYSKMFPRQSEVSSWLHRRVQCLILGQLFVCGSTSFFRVPPRGVVLVVKTFPFQSQCKSGWETGTQIQRKISAVLRNMSRMTWTMPRRI